MITTVLISWLDKVYRPAGYHVPGEGEVYVSKTGKAVPYVKGCITDGPRLILREYQEGENVKVDSRTTKA